MEMREFMMMTPGFQCCCSRGCKREIEKDSKRKESTLDGCVKWNFFEKL